MIFFFFFALLAVYSINGQDTSFIDKDSKVARFAEPQWLKDNIPFIEIPDQTIEDVYYYRFTSLKRHLRYTLPGAGYIVTEFVHKVGYSQKFDTINAAAGHHIDEGRWLRNTRYVKDYINVWAREGAGNQQYSEWIADSSYNAFLVNGDSDFIKSQQDGLVTNFNGWDDRFEPKLNLYFLSPHDDAMEQSASSIQTDDPYHGGLGYRPSFNSEMYANAIAISKIARMNNDEATAQEFESRGEAIRQGIMDHLWDNDRMFFYHVFRDDNPNNELLDTREEIGFFPWRWDVPDKADLKYGTAWESLFDPQGFESVYGPTTCEQRSQWFEGNQTHTCCWWNGNSWPYSTGHTLRALAVQVKRYAVTAFANVESFIALLHKYAVTQHRDGIPYVAECHSALYDHWVCDSFNHSEHYAHSTYCDNVLTDLIGIEPQADNTFQVNPLVPSSWTFFLAENIAYHGHNITVMYDADGTKYQTGNVGLQIFVNGQLAAVQAQVGLMKINIPPPIMDSNYRGSDRVENYAANVNGFGYPMVDTSFTSIDASVWQVVDGRVFYDHIPSNRWTNFDSPNPVDWFSVDFGPGRVKQINQVKLYIFSDYAVGLGQVDCPSSTVVEYLNAGVWTAAKNQITTPTVCVPNDVMTIKFDPITVQQLRVVFERNVENNTFVGLTELEIWAPWPQAPEGIYEAEDGLIGLADIHASNTASGGSYVSPIDDPEAFIEFTGVWVNQDNTYGIQIYYTNAENNVAKMNIIVNNVHFQEVYFPQTSTVWGDFDPSSFITFEVPLMRGNNVIILKHSENLVELDKIYVRQ